MTPGTGSRVPGNRDNGRFSPGAFQSLFAGRRILWQCFFGAYCVGLDVLLPIELVRSLDDGSDFDLITDGCGIHFATVEHANGPERRRRNWIGASIDVGFEQCRAAVEDRLRAHPRESWWLTSSPASGRLAAYCREHGYRYVGPSLESQQGFQAKSCLLEVLRDLRLPRMEGEWCSLRNTTHAELARRWGQPLVLQAALGAAGSGTRLVRSETDLRRVAPFFGDERVLVSPYLGRTSLNINAAVIGEEPFVGPPSVQLAGIDVLGAPWGGYCGNDYSAAGLDGALVATVQDQTERIGWWMAARGFQGLYGLDFVISEQDGRAYAVDLNPRWQGSTALSIQAELAHGRLPLAAAEFACRARVISPADVKVHADEFRRPLTGAQMCLRAPRDRALRVTGDPRPGVYESAAEPRFVTSGFRLADCAGDDQWLITGGVPRTGTQVEPGAWLARIYTDRSVVVGDSSALSPWASQVAAHALASMGLVADSAAGTSS